jgi:hypothetical protein
VDRRRPRNKRERKFNKGIIRRNNPEEYGARTGIRG